MVAEQSAQLVDVLPREDFESEHIPGAISLPLKELNATSAHALDGVRPLIVYCNDFL